jgi:hypothetical protein
VARFACNVLGGRASNGLGGCAPNVAGRLRLYRAWTCRSNVLGGSGAAGLHDARIRSRSECAARKSGSMARAASMAFERFRTIAGIDEAAWPL